MREGTREGGREGGRERWMEGGNEGGNEGGRREKQCEHNLYNQNVKCRTINSVFSSAV